MHHYHTTLIFILFTHFLLMSICCFLDLLMPLLPVLFLRSCTFLVINNLYQWLKLKNAYPHCKVSKSVTTFYFSKRKPTKISPCNPPRIYWNLKSIHNKFQKNYWSVFFFWKSYTWAEIYNVAIRSISNFSRGWINY